MSFKDKLKQYLPAFLIAGASGNINAAEQQISENKDTAPQPFEISISSASQSYHETNLDNNNETFMKRSSTETWNDSKPSRTSSKRILRKINDGKGNTFINFSSINADNNKNSYNERTHLRLKDGKMVDITKFDLFGKIDKGNYQKVDSGRYEELSPEQIAQNGEVLNEIAQESKEMYGEDISRVITGFATGYLMPKYGETETKSFQISTVEHYSNSTKQLTPQMFAQSQKTK